MGEFSPTREYFIKTSASKSKMPSMHYHASYELYYLEAGSREYFVEDKFFSVAAGSFVLIPPGKLHRTGGEYGLRTLVIFTDGFLLRNFTEETVSKLLQCFSSLRIIPPAEKQEDLRRTLKQLQNSQSETEFAIYLAVLLNELSKCTAEENDDTFVGMVAEYLNRNYSRSCPLETVAAEFYISKYHLCRVFRKAMGVTVNDYLNQVRVKNACGFLESSDKSIRDIARLCGFQSTAYFSNLFKKHMQISPSEYRLRRKQKQ